MKKSMLDQKTKVIGLVEGEGTTKLFSDWTPLQKYLKYDPKSQNQLPKSQNNKT